MNTAKALLSFIALYAIGRPRSGAAVAVNGIMSVGRSEIIFLVGAALFAGGVAAIIHLELGKIVTQNINNLPYRKMCLMVMVGITGLSFYYAGFWGIVILITGTSLGLLPPTA